MKRTKKQRVLRMQISCRTSFRAEESFVLKVTGFYIGKVRACTYCKELSKKIPYYVQCHLPGFKTHIGNYPSEKEARNTCLRIASLFIQNLNARET